MSCELLQGPEAEREREIREDIYEVNIRELFKLFERRDLCELIKGPKVDEIHRHVMRY
jgi:hypothetical protein